MRYARLLLMMISLLATLSSVATASEPCPPSVVIDGASATVTALLSSTNLSDMSHTALPGCPAVRVTIDTHANGFLLRIEDHLGRRYERTVGDVETAAAVIESWARGDALMSPLPDLPSEPSVDTTPEPPRTLPTETEQCDDKVTPMRDITVGVAFEFAMGADRSTWFGGRAHWCTMLGLTCFGAVIRGAADPTVSGDYRHLTDIRSSMDVLLSLALPFSVRRVRISPAVGFGVGWVQTSRNVGTDLAPEVRETSFGGGRLDLSFALSINLAGGLYLDAAVGFTTSFINEGELVTIKGDTVAGEPRNYFRSLLGIAYRWHG